jgi:hypothetical protein
MDPLAGVTLDDEQCPSVSVNILKFASPGGDAESGLSLDFDGSAEIGGDQIERGRSASLSFNIEEACTGEVLDGTMLAVASRAP